MPYINLGSTKKHRIRSNTKGTNKKIRSKFYSTDEWRKMRLAHLYEFPLCRICQLKGIIEGDEDKYLNLADECHHWISFMKGNDYNQRSALFYDPTNIVSVCKRCHSEIHNGKLKYCECEDDIKDRLRSIKEEEEDLKKHLYNNNKKQQ